MQKGRKIQLTLLHSCISIFLHSNTSFSFGKDFYTRDIDVSVCEWLPVSNVSFLPLAKGWEAHYHADGHQRNESGVDFHDRHRKTVCELLHAYYFRVIHRTAAVYGRMK